MKAVRWHKRGDVRFEEVEDVRPPGPNEVQLDVEWCGICGTDVEEFTCGPLVIPTTPHPLTGFCAPMIMGHEVAGRIRRVGSGVSNVAVGDLVGLDGSFFCGQCPACRRHQFNVCPQWAFIGMSYPGGLAEQMIVPAYMALRVSREVPAEWIALAEPISVAVRSIRRGRLEAGEDVLILGGGAVGLGVLQVAQEMGASQVTVIENVAFRRKLAMELGATQALAPESDLVQQVRDVCHGGPDLIFDCTGSNEIPSQAILAVRLGGRIVQVGLPPTPRQFDILQIALREIELIGTLGHVYDEDYSSALELITSERVQVAPLITHRLMLKDTVAEGFSKLAANAIENVLKVVITPKQSLAS
jgi:(R,R)-butanediol dehydrogenase/meso-butanediol dehydrogenase/diacetyl reductase